MPNTLVFDWYGSVCPRRFQPNEILQFSLKSYEFVDIVEKSKTVLIKLTKQSMPYTEGKTVFIPYNFFYRDFYQYLGIDNEKEQVEACLTLVNGAQLHEALHIKLLKRYFDYPTFVYGEHELGIPYSKKQFFPDIFNIVEDQYSETLFERENPMYASWLIEMRNILMNTKVFNENKEQYLLEEEKAQNRIALLSMYRRKENLYEWSNSLFDKATDILYRAENNTLNLRDRISIAIELYELIVPKEEQIEDSSNSSSSYGLCSMDLPTDEMQTSDDVQEMTSDMARTGFVEQLDKAHREIADNPELKNINIPVQLKSVSDEKENYTITGDENFSNFADYIKFARALKNESRYANR